MTGTFVRVQTAGVRRVLGWSCGLIGVVSTGIAAALELSHRGPRDMSVLELAATCVAVIVSAVLGLRILERDPGRSMGWVLVLMAAVGGLLTLAEVYAFDALVRQQGPIWGATGADVVSEASWVVAYSALSAVALLFPTGRPSGPGWRPLAWCCVLAFPAAAVMITLQPGPQDEPFAGLDNPAGVAWVGTGAGQALTAAVMLASLGCMAGCVASLLDRFVRAGPLERQQIKALLYAASLTPLAFIACLALRSDALATVVLPMALALVPLAVGLAVLRFRLYDVDRLINRTAVYVVLTALLALAYLAVSAAVGLVAPSPLATAVATALIVLAFRPVRDFLQLQIDRRFARSSARARALLRSFTDDLRQGRRSPADLEQVLAAAFEDPALELGFGPAAEPDGWVPLGRGGARIRSTVARPGLLLDTVAAESAMALEIARLHAEVVEQTEFVAEAQLRIAQAGFEERLRVERDLHDGAQQRLLSLGLMLRRLQRSLPTGARILEPALDQAVDEIGRTIADLRRLAGGDPPSSLQRGLGPALVELAEGFPVPLEVDLPGARLPERVEAAAYFVACEAVTNAVKHAGASRILLRAGIVDGALHVTVTDDGRGGAQAGGSGLAGLAERVRAHGGTLVLDSPVGVGTTLEAVIPCGS